MGKKISEIFFVIVFFPITIIFFIFKFIYKQISKKRISKYISELTLENIDNLSGVDFEDFLYYLLTNVGFKVKRTKKSYDYGADLIINLKNEIIVIQCKLYNNHSVGNSAVQEVYSATNYYNASLGIVITNSYFSKSAINLANKSGILLWNRNTINQLIKLEENQKKSFINELYLSAISKQTA